MPTVFIDLDRVNKEMETPGKMISPSDNWFSIESMLTADIFWTWYTFPELTGEELYSILKLRQQIFVVEQDCAYLDCDGLDQSCLHLAGWKNTGDSRELMAYLRVLPPDVENALPAIGRVIIHPAERGKGLGREVMQRGLTQLNRSFPDKVVRISAQEYLVNFYTSFGFLPSSEIYLEDGIPHIEMILKPCSIDPSI